MQTEHPHSLEWHNSNIMKSPDLNYTQDAMAMFTLGREARPKEPRMPRNNLSELLTVYIKVGLEERDSLLHRMLQRVVQ